MDDCGSFTPQRCIASLLDNDLCKLTMQSAILEYFPRIQVTYTLENRTPKKQFSRAAFVWLQAQINRLHNLSLSEDELLFLRSKCPFLGQSYLAFIKDFRFDPENHVVVTFATLVDTEKDTDIGNIELSVEGLWVETTLYEVPLLALTSEAYFRFMDCDWTYDGQEDCAYAKGQRLLAAGCTFAEYGTRRRRDFYTQYLVLRGLMEAKSLGEKSELPGRFSGTSNVHLAMQFGIQPMGTVAHEWFMGISAITNDYGNCTKKALAYWVDHFGDGIWKVAPTDTFGTEHFLASFRQSILPLTHYTQFIEKDIVSDPSPSKEDSGLSVLSSRSVTFADVFSGVRQDSGDPATFIRTMREFYDREGITKDVTLVFSDSLSVESCITYRKWAEDACFQSAFGIGTSFTNDFVRSNGHRSTPLNIVLKLTSADGKPAIKISDSIGKNSGHKGTIARVKKDIGYTESAWAGSNESTRWGPDEHLTGN